MKLKKWLGNHKTQVATGGGIAALILSNVLTGVATWRSIRKNDAVEAELGRKTTKKEKVKILWKYWVAPVTAAGAGAAGVIWSDKKQIKISSAALAACSIEKKNFDEYKEIVAKKLDEKTQNEIQKEYEEKQISDIDARLSEYDISIPTGNQRYVYDLAFATRFIASIDDIYAGLNRFNSRQNQFCGNGTVDDLYDEWEVSNEWRPEMLRRSGWEDGVQVEIENIDPNKGPVHSIVTPDGIPRIVINYVNKPKTLY